MATQEQRIRDFIDDDLKIFSNLDNRRSIPSLIDGLKDSQRKALFGMIKHGQAEIKVAHLGPYAGIQTDYEHGEVSMLGTIVGMAQNFTGSNNINLFEPLGQFGSIMSAEGGSPRYIYTKPSKYLRQYFLKDDDDVLSYREDEGNSYEPLYYLPIVPMWIVNGVDGIGTGHASKVLSRDPKKVCDLVSKLVKGVAVQQKTIDAAMTPYFEGWTGRIEQREPGDFTKWDLYGTIEKVNSTTLRISELPVGYDVDKFKEILINLMEEGKIKDFDNDSNEQRFMFVVTAPREVVRKEIPELVKMFKLVERVGENVTLWDVNGKLRRFDNAYEALQEFLKFRVAQYQPRKSLLLKQYQDEIDWLNAKGIFIQAWNTEIGQPHLLSEDDLKKELTDRGVAEVHHERLLAMKISSLTMAKVAELKGELQTMTKKWSELNGKTTEQLYLDDLNCL